MNNKQKAENFLDNAKQAREHDISLSEWHLKLAKVHALLALEEAVRNTIND